ncbi:restriction endonuclease subunit S [Campylobacter devanensis]|uniref:restriction endonuclease subunit S n=1 Tax=Campylobacter devanensis TaxID=3161138 RepID=UPI00112F2F0C|nr:restriction endonuclease subunit S [Campylobacter sp. P146]
MSNKNIEFKDSGIPWIGQIPKHWEVTKIKYCLKENFGGCWGDDLENEQISQNSRLCIRVADFDFDKQKVKQTADTFRNYTKSQILSTKLQDGDLIIEKSGGGDKMPVGRSVVFEQNLFGAKEVLFANFCQCFRPLNINNKFFAHAMKAFYQNNNMRFFFNQTTGIQNLSIFNILNAFLPYPPLNEQKEIVEFLDKKCEIIDKRLSNLERKIKSLKEYKKSLISECVTKGLNPKNMEFKDSGISWCPQIPSDWQVINPKILFKQRNQKAKSGEIQYTASQEFGIISQEEYTRKTGYNMVKVLKGFDILKHVEVGDFVISMRSFQGGLEYSNVSGSISSAYVMLIPNSKFVNNRYFRWLFKSSKYIDALQSTTNLIRDGQAMRYSNFALIKLIVPPLNEQKEIAEFLDKKCEKIDRLNENYTKQITALKEYKKSLIYECVTGKKEI